MSVVQEARKRLAEPRERRLSGGSGLTDRQFGPQKPCDLKKKIDGDRSSFDVKVDLADALYAHDALRYWLWTAYTLQLVEASDSVNPSAYFDHVLGCEVSESPRVELDSLDGVHVQHIR